MIIFSDYRDPIFNSRDRIGSLKHLKKTCINVKGCCHQGWVTSEALPVSAQLQPHIFSARDIKLLINV